MSRVVQVNRHSSPGHFVNRSGQPAPSDPVDHTKYALALLVIVLVLWGLGGVTFQ
jgi:hypothetical protein